MPTKLWKKGESGNPNGRPEGSISVVSALKRELAKTPDGEKKTYLELLVKRMLKKGIVDGDVSMIKDIVNRTDGLPRQNLDVTSGGENIKQILVKFIDGKPEDNRDTD
jgi:hypothetical protein|tara:strand:- start:140 stop:463 length:324 start_codon:yes stop_codon:yes gene_type:complete